MITVEVIVQPNAVTVPVKVENKTIAQDVQSFAGVPPAPTGAPKVLKARGGGAFDYGWEDEAGGDGEGSQGSDGADGSSAYEIAVANDFVGTESEWLASLKGDDGEAGLAGAPGIDGADGLSAYEIAVANDFVGTESEWLASLKGDDGEAGLAGAPGSDGADGISAYQIAVANGFVGSESAWLASLKGDDGVAGLAGAPGSDGADGLSAYQIAVVNGFVGTESAWLASLHGDDGELAEIYSSPYSWQLDDFLTTPSASVGSLVRLNTYSGASASQVGGAGTDSAIHPGIIRLNSGTTAGGSSVRLWAVNGMAMTTAGGYKSFFVCRFKAFASHKHYIGWGNNNIYEAATDNISNGIYGVVDAAGVLTLYHESGGAKSASASTLTLALDTWYGFKITTGATSTLEVFTEAGTLISSLTVTNNYPASGIQEMNLIFASASVSTTVVPMADIDLIALKIPQQAHRSWIK